MANLQKGVLDKVDHFLSREKFSYEVIVVDDGSTDGSIEFVENFISENPTFRLVKNAHTGKAGAVTAGMLEAKGKYVLFTDMDQATPIEELHKLLPYFDENYDIVIGSRSTKRKGSPWTRVIMARANIELRKMLVGLSDIEDTQCGFKVFSRESAKKIFLKVKQIHRGFKTTSGSNVTSGFDVEFLYIAEMMGYKIKEVPVRWLYVETRRVSPLRDSIKGLQALFDIRNNIAKGLYR